MKNWALFIILVLIGCEVEKKKQNTTADNNQSTVAEKIEGVDVLSYSLEEKKDTIEYIKVGTDASTVKPTILFLQGSLPRPLIFDMGDFRHINLPFNYKQFTDKYNLVEITMPETPIVADKAHLNKQYSYVPDTTAKDSLSKDYLIDNHLQNYVDRTNAVITDLLKKQWIDKDSLILIGHSQGAKIAAVVTSENTDVSKVALLGFNAFGRYDEYIRRERHKLKSGQISGEEYKTNIKKLYIDWNNIHETPDKHQDGHNAWTSFSIDYMPYLLKIEVPLFIGFGTEDVIAENCDLIPLKFIEEGKDNLTLKPYPGLNHNFFEIKNGVPDRRNGAHFSDVVNDALKD